MRDQKVSRESHTWVQDRLSEYMDDRLSPLEKVQIERHLQTCQQCQHELDSLRWTVSLVQTAPKPKLPRQFTIPVTAVPSRSPIIGLSLLRLATAVATLVLVSLIGIDLIMQFGGAPAAAPVAPLSSARLAEPTRAALAVATSTEPRRDTVSGAAAQASQTTATPPPTAVPTTRAPASSSSSVASAASSAASSAAPTATAAAATAALLPPTAAPTSLAPKAFSGPASATRSSQQPTATATPSPTGIMLGLGAGPVPTSPANKSSDNSETTSVPPAVPPVVQDLATPEEPNVAPSALESVPAATETARVEAYNPVPGVPPQPTNSEPAQVSAGPAPLRVAELAALFVAVFLGSLLVLIGLRR